MATCSPASTRRLKSSSATLSPRTTRTFFKSTRAGPIGLIFPRLNHKRSPRVPLLELSPGTNRAESISKALLGASNRGRKFPRDKLKIAGEGKYAHFCKAGNPGQHSFLVAIL